MSIDLPMQSEDKGVFEYIGRIGKDKKLIKKGKRNMKNMKRNNKGFSMVELIIVIAIMAVLIGVLSPAYLRYVEKSRKSADIQAIDSIISAMETTAIDPEFDFGQDSADTMVATFAASGGALTFTGGGTSKAYEEVQNIVGTTYKLKSTDWAKDALKITAKINTTTGQITVELDGDSAADIKSAGDFPETVTVAAGD